MICKTVKIKDNSDSFIVINESDFDKEKHVLYNSDLKAEKAAIKAEKKAAKKAAKDQAID